MPSIFARDAPTAADAARYASLRYDDANMMARLFHAACQRRRYFSPLYADAALWHR